MNKVVSAAKLGISGVFQFSGRSSRSDFWIYAFILFLMAMGVWSFVMAIEMSRTFAEVQEYANVHPDKVTVTVGPSGATYRINGSAPGIGPNLGYMLWWLSGIAAASIALLASAAVHRLHDTDRTGLWVLLPLPFLVSGLWLMASLLNELNGSSEPDIGVFAIAGFVNNLIYLATLAVVGFLLLRSGSPGANRFGEREVEEQA